ncbi:MAG: hypothetical protein NTW29_20660 [Bacteroidetes bacterium]|nr:hypothetical protein [Bacteroidota bacterium]
MPQLREHAPQPPINAPQTGEHTTLPAENKHTLPENIPTPREHLPIAQMNNTGDNEADT